MENDVTKYSKEANEDEHKVKTEIPANIVAPGIFIIDIAREDYYEAIPANIMASDITNNPEGVLINCNVNIKADNIPYMVGAPIWSKTQPKYDAISHHELIKEAIN